MNDVYILLAVIFGIGLLRGAPPPGGFTALFNGKDLTGWRGGRAYGSGLFVSLVC